MVIRKLMPEDLEKHCHVSSMAFIWSVDLEKEALPENPVLGAFDDDNNILAELEYFPHEAFFCKKALPAVGIGGVGSLPEFRRKGSVRALFEEMERLSEETGWVLGFLYPFSYDYYRKFGYEAVIKKISLNAKAKALEAVPRCAGSLTMYTGQNSQELYDLYNKIARNTNLMFKRNDDTYFSAKPLKNTLYTYIWRYESGEAGAIVTYSLDRSTKTLNIKELFYLDKVALLGVLGFLRGYDGQAQFFDFEKLPTDSTLLHVLNEYNLTSMNISYSAAARIYNLEELLRQNEYPQEHGHFKLLSLDSYKRNAGIFEVEYQNGTAQVTRRSSGDFDISLTAPAAAKLLLSGEGFSAETAAYLSGVELRNKASDFFNAFPQRVTFLCDGF
jgi:predicted acetyltransferase